MGLARRSLLAGMAGAASALTTPTFASQFNDLKREIAKAIETGGRLSLPAGDYRAAALAIEAPLLIEGVPGLTRIIADDGGAALVIASSGVTLRGLTFVGTATIDANGQALVSVRNASDLAIDGCRFAGGESGLRLEGCGGRVTSCDFGGQALTAIFARDSTGLAVTGNSIADIGNNGIQIWRSQQGEDGTRVSDNRIARISAMADGDGQNGNGINIYRAGNVIVAGNRITDCAFSAIRNNAGDNCQIASNSISRTGDVAIFCEFGFSGAVVSGNLIEDVAFGISITNFNEGGRLALCSNNIVRRVTGGGSLANTTATAIAVEADTVVSGNVIEEVGANGIALGWGPYCRNLTASGNLLRGCGRAIAFSASDGVGPVMIRDNRISRSAIAIQGMDHAEAVTEDYGLAGAGSPQAGIIASNLVTPT